MPTVLIFKETLLPPSETFILAQMRALTKFSSHLVGLERTVKGIPLDETPLLLSRSASMAANLRAKFYRRTGFAPLFHRRVRLLQPDIVHAHLASGGMTLLPLLKALRRPLIVTLHGGSDVPIENRKRVFIESSPRRRAFLSAFLTLSANRRSKPGTPRRSRSSTTLVSTERSSFHRPNRLSRIRFCSLAGWLK